MARALLTSAVALGAAAAASAYSPAARRHFDVELRTQAAPGGGVRALVLPRGGGGNPIADAVLVDQINTTGWAQLQVTAAPAYSDEQMAYAAGYAEGALTWQLINDFILNTGSNFTLSPALTAFLEANEVFLRQSIDANPADVYWHHVGLIRFQQLEGLYYGYADTAAAAGAATVYPFAAFMNVQLNGDLEDLQAAVTLQGDPTARELPRHPRDEARGRARPRRRVDAASGAITADAGHCSALVKVLPGNADLLVSQVTWSGMESMTRLYKRYDLPYSLTGAKASGTVPATSVTFSSYPASLFSGDDWYQMSGPGVSMVMLETTIGNSNATLYQLYVKPTTVLEWTRNMLANRLASNGSSWVDIYSRYNSGSYNNENVLIDYSLFKPGQPLPDGLLTVADQVPGYISSGDLTYYLRDASYFPSYNLPVFPFIFNISGDYDAYVTGGDWFSYNKTARAQIFARNQSAVTDEAAFRALMRYNDFQHDPIATQGCGTNPPYSAENAIAARDDLNPANGVYPISALGHRDHAGIDAKYTSYAMMAGVGGYAPLSTGAQSGPTHDQQPPFSFSSSDLGLSHVGLPDVWAFPWVALEWPVGEQGDAQPQQRPL